MHIQIADEPFLDLTAWWIASHGMEFSGLGLVERERDVLNVVGVDLLNVGSFGYTEIPEQRQRALPLDPRRKLWFHRHPLGNAAKPGPQNWSGTDHGTAERTPLGGIPQLVQWSTSMVFTPTGWTGRVDVYLPKLQTFYIPVYPTVPSKEQMEQAYERVTPQLMEYVGELTAEFNELMSFKRYMPTEFDEPQDVEPLRIERRKRTPSVWVGGINIFRRYYEDR